MTKSIMAIAFVIFLSAPVAMAQQRGVCVADIKAKCAGVEPGEGRLVACVKHTPQNFPTRVRQGWRGSLRSPKPARVI